MSEESKRVMKHRNENFDQVGFLVEKGGRKLYRVIAAKEGVPTADMIRRAVLARAGLSVLPYPADLEQLEDAQTADEARQAIRDLQRKEAASETLQKIKRRLSAEPPDTIFTAPIEMWDTDELEEIARRITATISKRIGDGNVLQLRMRGSEIAALRRLLANIEQAERK